MPLKLTRKPSTPARPARGFAAMRPATRSAIARQGGLAVSRNRAHMADIGSLGGKSSGQRSLDRHAARPRR